MSRLFMFEKPLGMRDTLPELYETKHSVRTTISEVMKKWGYQFIETPTLDDYETVGSASAILDQQLFKLLDQQGHTLVLRPDMTAPIVRVAASKLLKEELPLRLGYSANVFRAIIVPEAPTTPSAITPSIFSHSTSASRHLWCESNCNVPTISTGFPLLQ